MTTPNVAAWYPEEDMIELVRVLAQLIPGSRSPLCSLTEPGVRFENAWCVRTYI